MVVTRFEAVVATFTSLSMLGCAAESAKSGRDSSATGGSQSGSGATGGSVPIGGASSNSGGTSNSGRGTGTSGGSGNAGARPISDDIGAAEFAAGELDDASNGATITFQSIGAKGWYPSRRDPASGNCDAVDNGECCMTKHELTSDQLSPWNEELIITLRGPMLVKQFAAYQPDSATGNWHAVASWDERSKSNPQGVAFEGNGSEKTGFSGAIGTECLVDVSSNAKFGCGTGVNPYCPKPAADIVKYYGWQGSKLFVLLAAMPHVGSNLLSNVTACSTETSGNWFDAPWIGLSHGELIRSGKFGNCHCYSKNPAEWWLADGCGQFNAFEVVNDNNEFKNLDVFSTNLFAYHGYVGEGPCGSQCNLSSIGKEADLIDKASSTAASQGATASPSKGPGAAFRRPASGYRYFLVLFDVPSRSIQLAIIHPERIPATAAALLPNLPKNLDTSAIDALLALRLPK